MAYYEFFNLPQVTGWPVVPKVLAKIKGRGVEGSNPFAETAPADDLQISIHGAANPSPFGWIGSGPDWFNVTIRRRVKDHTNAAAAVSMNIAIGDLILYRLALMSTMKEWTCLVAEKDKWPKAHLELDNQTGVVLKYRLERLVIDSWSLEAARKREGPGEMHESLSFRAWVVEQERDSGNPLRVALGNSDPSK